MKPEVFSSHVDGDSLAAKAAADLSVRIVQLIQKQDLVHVVLTGGSVGIKTLEKLAVHLAQEDLSNLHLWWGDERFVEPDSPDRNFVQADAALLSKVSVPPQNIHQMPSNVDGDIDEAAEHFAAHLEDVAPQFDIVLLGMGPDGHVASLFPRSRAREVGELVVVEKSSPKPPANRISLSYEALNSSKDVWFLVSGNDKSEAVSKVFRGENLPAQKIHGQEATRWYLDEAAASQITS